MKLHTQKVALFMGLLIGGLHLVWATIIALGLAQPLMDFIFWLHMLNNPFEVVPFSLTTALFLVVVTFCVGYSAGFIFATLWNGLHKK